MNSGHSAQSASTKARYGRRLMFTPEVARRLRAGRLRCLDSSLFVHRWLVLADGEADRLGALDDPVGVLPGDEGLRQRLGAGAAAVAEDVDHARRQVR